jgi:hypothetical protein
MSLTFFKSSIMKTFLGKSSLSIILILSILFLAWQNHRLRADVKIYRNNQQHLITGAAHQVDLTRREMKQYIRQNQQLSGKLDSMKIRANQVTHIITSEYKLRDTVIRSSVIHYDTTRTSATFNLAAGCFRITGAITPDSIHTTSVTMNDNLTLVQYRKWKHRIAISRKWDLLHWGKYYSAQLWSDCRRDTIPITRNLHLR